MKKSSKPQAGADGTAPAQKLQLPVEPEFVSFPPDVSLARALVLNEQARAWFPQSVPTPEERLARKVDVEFVL